MTMLKDKILEVLKTKCLEADLYEKWELHKIKSVSNIDKVIDSRQSEVKFLEDIEKAGLGDKLKLYSQRHGDITSAKDLGLYFSVQIVYSPAIIKIRN